MTSKHEVSVRAGFVYLDEVTPSGDDSGKHNRLRLAELFPNEAEKIGGELVKAAKTAKKQRLDKLIVDHSIAVKRAENAIAQRDKLGHELKLALTPEAIERSDSRTPPLDLPMGAEPRASGQTLTVVFMEEPAEIPPAALAALGLPCASVGG
ncbi:hypothetical protein [Blastochloris tepida]|uniref:Uncharacterized protein n=1 Tax=Blastochloris tepida TaxID=2233851 RepID=A0A348FZC2_9HYPH|nr:hypothetical protein [Blastochloris tepida]BBF92655.1 hypothetical protein BLTE_13400 [Blastochloris tepida]